LKRKTPFQFADSPYKRCCGDASDTAVNQSSAMTRLPEFLMQRQGFYSRGGGERWKPSRPYHVALEDSYVRAHWNEIDALCKLNSTPFNATGEKIRDSGVWCVYEFTWQLDAIQFWDRFEGRWLRGSEFHYPERQGFAAYEAAQELAEVRSAKSEGITGVRPIKLYKSRYRPVVPAKVAITSISRYRCDESLRGISGDRERP
jgi:hypothetical protein